MVHATSGSENGFWKAASSFFGIHHTDVDFLYKIESIPN
jgi:hypothetical protein